MRIHFIAIGGAAMHNLALALLKKGYTVTGSDDEIFEPSRSRLEQAGILPEEYGWFPERISSGMDAVILGMHAKKDNPELLKARSLGVKIYSYPEFLYEQTKGKTRVVIGGSHGKTTITSMVMHVLKEAGVSFDYMVGSQIDGFETMVALEEENSVAVFEGDEYLSSPIDRRPKFHLYKPHIGLINGIAWDHINVFPTYEIYKEQFRIFINEVIEEGVLLYNTSDPETKDLVEGNLREDLETIGYSAPKYTSEDGICFLVLGNSKKVPLKIFGEHNLQNLAGAKEICNKLGVDDGGFYTAISSFRGSRKRMQVLFESEDKMVILDFAHAPSKVEATVKAVKEQYPEHELTACLELHTFSSLNKGFIDGYKKTLDKADKAVLFYNPDVVKQKRLPEINEEEIIKAFDREDLKVVTSTTGLIDLLKKDSNKEGRKTCLFMSSGNFGGLAAKEMVNLSLG